MPRVKFIKDARVRISGTEWQTLFLAGKTYELKKDAIKRWVRRGIAIDLTPPPKPIPDSIEEDQSPEYDPPPPPTTDEKPEPPPPPPPPKKTRRKRKSPKQ